MEVIEVSKTTIYVLLGTIALLEVIILLFQSQLFKQRKELKELLGSNKLGKTSECSSNNNKSSSTPSS